MYKILLFCFLYLSFETAAGQAQTSAPAQKSDIKPNSEAKQKLYNVDKLFFIENKGQWPKEVLYLTQNAGVNTWITSKGMWYEFYQNQEIKPLDKAMRGKFAIPEKFEPKEIKRWGHRVGYTLIGNNPTVNTQASQKQDGYYNYLIGNDPTKHASNVGLYKEVIVREVYDGIDMRYYFDKGSLRYDYVVKPGADASQIRFKFEGSDRSYLNEKGELIFTTCFGEVKNADLFCYQQQGNLTGGKPVAAQFTKQGEHWVFALGDYEKSQTLIIDPLIYSTYIGGSGEDLGNSIALDALGNAYITGYTASFNYDITPGAFQSIISGGEDAFVTKLNAPGTALIYSTYIGGSGDERANDIAIDISGSAYIAGYTFSTNFDITPGAFQSTNEGTMDVFVCKLNTTGTALIYSTYIGGINGDRAHSVAVDATNNVYITGITHSADFDIIPGAFQPTIDGLSDVFVSKLNALGSALIYSTYIGGNSNDIGNSIALDVLGNTYISGASQSTNYDITPGAFQTTYGGGYWDGFVSKLNASGTALIYSTLIGGSFSDQSYSIALDASGNAYITGSTQSPNYDITPGAFHTTYLGGSGDIFVTKLNVTGTALIYSTFIGGNAGEEAFSIALDATSNAYITGFTSSSGYDITPGAFQTNIASNWDVIVSKINTTGTALIYSTYIGGSIEHYGYAIALDASNNVYITGLTVSSDYDITPGAFQTIFGGGNFDVFVTKLSLSYPLPIELIEFEGLAMKNENEITWKTAAELNFSHYDLESAEDGIHFKIVETILGLGNSNEIKCYTYQDKNYYSPLTYYRLKSVDLDGSSNYSEIISLKRDENLSGVVVYPNPSQGVYQIEFDYGSSAYNQIEVLDIQGNLIEKQNISNKKSSSLDLSKQAAGVYILKVKSNNQQEIVRLIKL